MLTRRRLFGLMLVVAMVGALLASTTSALGHHGDPEDGLLQLHMNNDGRFFHHDGADQNLPTDKCKVVDDPLDDELVSLDPKTGINKDSLGIKTGGATGVKCGRTSGNEVLTLALAGLLETLEIERAELDVEVKQDAEIVATTYLDGYPVGTYTLRSGDSIIANEGVDGTANEATSADDDPSTAVIDESIANCGALSDSGPDSGASDNCRWVIDASTPFDTIELTANAGQFGLEGGEDGTPAATTSPASFPLAEGSDSDSLFFLTDIDGILACGDTVRETEGTLEGTFTRIDDSSSGGNCELKPYTLEIDVIGETISFIPEGDPATYSAILTKSPDPSGTVPEVPVLEYDDFTVGTDTGNAENSGFRAMLTCDAATFGTTTFGSETIPIVEAATIPASDDPGRPHTFCIAQVTGESTASFQWTWLIFGVADPSYGWK